MVLFIQASKAGKSTPKNNYFFSSEIKLRAKELLIWGAPLLEKDLKSIQLKVWLWARDSSETLKHTGWRQLWTGPVSGRLIPDGSGKETSTIIARLVQQCHRNSNQRVSLHSNEQRKETKRQQSSFCSHPRWCSRASGFRNPYLIS